eukprot:CAMPEP_0196144462 /NCGR_PEP_ID=MMETSP0910-20130528/16438_1 /TAXON_ID=49265 /ORGANISM="Thalassiosira rotula, Strain GSO102" /LENGTH=755 /DNA_ID=CAMNT_0041406117 /DNA_START=111 /DNA_END=2378 /DNA_ORIENTATION=+
MEIPTSESLPTLSAQTLTPSTHRSSRVSRKSRASVLCNPRGNRKTTLDPNLQSQIEIEFKEDDYNITPERLERVRASVRFNDPSVSQLSARERKTLVLGQKLIIEALMIEEDEDEDDVNDNDEAEAATRSSMNGMQIMGGNSMSRRTMTTSVPLVSEVIEEEEEEEEEGKEVDEPRRNSFSLPPQDQTKDSDRHSLGTVKAQLMKAKFRSRLHKENDGVLGIQHETPHKRNKMMNSVFGDKFGMYQMRMSASSRGIDLDQLGMNGIAEENEGEEEEIKEMDVEDISYVRKPNLARIIEEYDAMQHHPKYNLKQVVLSRRFHLYAHRFANAQYQHALVYPSLPQPPELCPWLSSLQFCGECKEEEKPSEKQRTRTNGHRFIIAADSQFGILMDGFPMELPNWSQEIEISRKCVAQINAMHGDKRPLFVSVCGDLVDTESSFSGAIASWKKVMNGWERNLVFEQQVKDFKRVWAGLDPDIALVCMCGNHDVGNRPTRASIKHWTSEFGDDYLSFWANGTFNICLNNCLFSNPTGAPDLYEEQLEWMEKQLVYARENDATHIFVYGHFPWFLKHEEEADDFLTSFSSAPEGWGPPGSRFADSYFTIPYEQRKIAMAMFKKYDVTACFSGHFHQNVVAQTSWGMPMIVTGPLSMNLDSEIGHELAPGETNGIGMRVVDVGEKGEFTHKWTLLVDEEELYVNALRRISKSMMKNPLPEEAEKRKSRMSEILSSLIDFDDVELSDMEAQQWAISHMFLEEE